MRDAICKQFTCTITQWAEWDGEREAFTAIQFGVVIHADSLALLISALQDAIHLPLELAA